MIECLRELKAISLFWKFYFIFFGYHFLAIVITQLLLSAIPIVCAYKISYPLFDDQI